MGQEKTQRENGREQRNEQQGRVGRRMGLGVILCGPLPATVSGQGKGHQQQLTRQGQSSPAWSALCWMEKGLFPLAVDQLHRPGTLRRSCEP